MQSDEYTFLAAKMIYPICAAYVQQLFVIK